MKLSRFPLSVVICAVCALGMGPLGAQSASITTADTFFSAISDNYASITDYSAAIVISAGGASKTDVMKGQVYFKKPDLLRIDFSSPAEQTIVFDGKTLTIYLPGYNVVLNQAVDSSNSGGAAGASLATPQGLSLLKRYYAIAYEKDATPVPLEEGSKESVVILALSRRSTTESFRTLRLMIDPVSKMIRRIDARNLAGDRIVFDFTSYKIDQKIPDSRFAYESPASANMFNNFLFTQ